MTAGMSGAVEDVYIAVKDGYIRSSDVANLYFLFIKHRHYQDAS